MPCGAHGDGYRFGSRLADPYRVADHGRPELVPGAAMTLPLWVAGIGLGALVLYAVRAYRQAKVREALDRPAPEPLVDTVSYPPTMDERLDMAVERALRKWRVNGR